MHNSSTSSHVTMTGECLIYSSSICSGVILFAYWKVGEFENETELVKETKTSKLNRHLKIFPIAYKLGLEWDISDGLLLI